MSSLVNANAANPLRELVNLLKKINEFSGIFLYFLSYLVKIYFLNHFFLTLALVDQASHIDVFARSSLQILHLPFAKIRQFHWLVQWEMLQLQLSTKRENK